MRFRLVHPGFAPSIGALVILTGLAVPAVAALPPAGAISLDPAVVHLVSDARRAIAAGNVRQAIIYLKLASSADPRNGRIRAQLGKAFMEAGDYASAEGELRLARGYGAPEQLVLPILLQSMLAQDEDKLLLDEFPEPTSLSGSGLDILKARALALLNSGQISEATTAIEKALKVQRDVPGLLVRARIAENSGTPALALQIANAALAMDPGNTEALLFKASLLVDTNDMGGALALTERVLSRSPSNLAAQFSLIDLLMRTKQDNKAKALVDGLLVQYPELPIALYYRALLVARAGDNKSAWRIAQGLPKKFMTSQPQIAVSVSRMADASGDSDTGAGILALAVVHFPQNDQLRIQLAAVRLKQNDINAALDAVKPINTLDPDTAQAAAEVFVRSKRPDLALEVLQRLEQAGKATDIITLNVVSLESAMGQKDQAFKDLSEAADRKPGDPVLADQLITALVARKQFADAIAVADRLYKEPAQRRLSLVLRGQVLLAQNRLDDALEAFGAALQIDPKSEVALYGKTIALEQMGRLDEALNNIRVILKLNPRSMPAYLKWAEIAARRNDDGHVRSALGAAIKSAPGDPAPRLAFARYLAGRNDQGGAVKAVESVLNIQPKNTDALELLGTIDLAIGKKSDAVATFRHLAALAPGAPGPEIFLARALFANGDQAGANAALRSAVALGPASAEVRQAEIDMLLAEKDTSGAIGSAEVYQKANPGTEADLILADTLARAGRQDQAMIVYQKSFSARPASMTVLRLAGTAASNGDTKTAAEALSGWIKDNPGDNPARLAYASLLMQQGKTDEAIGQLREILKTDAYNLHALNNLAWLMADRDPKTAIALANKATSLAPNSSEVLDTLGWLQFKHGSAAEGLSALKKAHDLSPQDGEISYHLALNLYATGNRDAARGFLRALLASQVNFTDRQEANKLAQVWH